MQKVSKTVRIHTVNNLYKAMKNKKAAQTLENNVFKLSKGVPSVYYNYNSKIMVLILPKKN
tara:strand:- start:1923 stop:2105 length:183 start_codon:yes stop_codon:yes gene_type:complete